MRKKMFFWTACGWWWLLTMSYNHLKQKMAIDLCAKCQFYPLIKLFTTEGSSMLVCKLSLGQNPIRKKVKKCISYSPTSKLTQPNWVYCSNLLILESQNHNRLLIVTKHFLTSLERRELWAFRSSRSSRVNLFYRFNLYQTADSKLKNLDNFWKILQKMS